MDYKEKYEQALERAKEWFNPEEPDSYTCIVESIFPELREPEDEFKWLIQFIEEEAYNLSIDIRGDEDRTKLKNLQRSYAWLEKQKKKSTWTDDDRIMVFTLLRDIEQATHISNEKKNKCLEWLNSLEDRLKL